MSQDQESRSDGRAFEDFDLVVDGARRASLTFGISLYTDVLLSSAPDAVLGCFDRFLRLCPPEKLQFYATENMTKHKAVTKRTFEMLKTWLKPGAPPRSYLVLEMKDGDAFNLAPKFKFDVWGNEPGSTGFSNKNANLINMAFPPEWGVERSREMLEFFKDLTGVFPYQSGHAGFSFQCSPYWQKEAQNYAWSKSMRHRGIDIFAHPNDKMAAGHDAIKGVNWLTLLCDPFVSRLAGLDRLKASVIDTVDVQTVPGGVLLVAGQLPRIGDTNRQDFLPEYKSVYKAVAPLATIGESRTPALLAGKMTDYTDNTIAWRRRFAHD
jgi:hypothetical protein